MKHRETLAPIIETSLFQECFKSETANWLFFNAKNFFQECLKQGCFTKCFNNISLIGYLNSDYGVLKHFLQDMMKTHFSYNPRLKSLGY